MFVIALTGGVGCGKSTVAKMLRSKDLFLIDADVLAREVLDPKSAVLNAVVGRFGEKILTKSGELSRSLLAEIVFSDKKALSDLDSIVHPAVRLRVSELLNSRSAAESLAVLLMVPLLFESGNYQYDVSVVVDCEMSVVKSRLVETRGWTPMQIEQRVCAQMSREDRIMKADYVISNNGTFENLQEAVDEFWKWLQIKRSNLA